MQIQARTMQIQARRFQSLPTTGNLVLFLRKGKSLCCPDIQWPKPLTAVAGKALQAFAEGERKEVEVLPWGDGELLLVNDNQPAGLDARDSLRLMGSRALDRARARQLAKFSVALPEASLEEVLALAEGLRFGSYRFTAYKSKPQKFTGPAAIEILVGDALVKPLAAALKAQAELFTHVDLARSLVNTPGSDLVPAAYAEMVRELFAEVPDVGVKIRDYKALVREGFNGLVAVGKGSPHLPHLVTLHYKPAKARKGVRLGLVGKGLTFDTGGISLKPATDMWEMKMDMAGSAAVVGAMLAIAERKLPVEVVAVLCLAENRPSGVAQLPGDIFKAKNGKTVMVDNTDAEGRLVLTDGLWEAGAHKCTHIVDLATLTGAVIRALGPVMTGLFANDDAFAQRIEGIGKQEGEKFWRLPLEAEYREGLDDTVADLKNVSGVAGAITAGLFLQEFVPAGAQWSHWDIAGTAFTDKAWKYYGKGATGWGVKSLVGLAENELEADPALWRRLLHPDDLEQADQAVAGALKDGTSFQVEIRLLHKAGHYVPVQTRGFILRDQHGKPLRIFGVNTSQADRHRAETER
jgi:leucyl aminopeptidase